MTGSFDGDVDTNPGEERKPGAGGTNAGGANAGGANAGGANAGGSKRFAVARFAAALSVAAASDFLSAWTEFFMPLQWALDLLTAGILFMILGRQWLLLPGLIAEAIPGIALFPSWVLVVASIGVWGAIGPRRSS